MTYKTIAALITDTDTDGAVLAAAAQLARSEGAHLDVFCLAVERTRHHASFPFADLAIVQVGLEDARAAALDLRAWAQDQMAARMPGAVVEPVVIPDVGLETGLARRLRYADLIFCAPPSRQGRGTDGAEALEAVLFGTGTPLVVVGAEADLSAAPRRVLVAWDESAEALSAIKLSLPLLQQAGQVDVVMVDPPVHSAERSDPGGGLSVMLARHGVRPQISILSRTLPRVADVLIRFARDKGCDLVVMGAYGHSRMREAILGGPTRDMLESADLPLFMAH